MPCLGYKLELERLDIDEDDEELKMSGEAYAMIATPQLGDAPYESFVILIDVAGTTYTILFTEHPTLGSEVEMEVELDADWSIQASFFRTFPFFSRREGQLNTQYVCVNFWDVCARALKMKPTTPVLCGWFVGFSEDDTRAYCSSGPKILMEKL